MYDPCRRVMETKTHHLFFLAPSVTHALALIEHLHTLRGIISNYSIIRYCTLISAGIRPEGGNLITFPPTVLKELSNNITRCSNRFLMNARETKEPTVVVITQCSQLPGLSQMVSLWGQCSGACSYFSKRVITPWCAGRRLTCLLSV